MSPKRIGVAVSAADATSVMSNIENAEQAGLHATWLTTGGAGLDGLTLFAAAAARTKSVMFGTSIVPTFPRHPIVVAQQVQVLDLPSRSGRVPYPTLRPLAVRPAMVAAAFERSPELEVDYTTLLEQWAEIFLHLGDVLVDAGKLEEALQVFEYLWSKSPDDKALAFALGELYKMLASSGAVGAG